MVPEHAHGVLLDVCPNCGGIWITADELRALMTGDPSVLLELEKSIHTDVEQKHLGQSKLLCPDHQVLLDQYHYLYDSPVLIHACPDCGGLFITADELPQMQQWYAKSHEPASPDEQKRIALGMDVAQHEAFMMRQQHLQGLFNTLRTFRPGWSGFFP